MSTIIAVISQKGGTGKTTTVRTLADAFRGAGRSTLAIDLDPQGSLSDYCDVPPDASPSITDVLIGGVPALDAVHDDVIPANLSLVEAELAMAGKMGRDLTLKRAIRDARSRYEMILIDCPPTLGLLTINALAAADRALITTEAKYLSLQGVEQALEVVEIARDSLNPDLETIGVALNMADLRLIHARESQVTLRERFGDLVFETVIRQSVRYSESAERAISIIDYRPYLGADYMNLAAEVLARLDAPKSERSRLTAAAAAAAL